MARFSVVGVLALAASACPPASARPSTTPARSWRTSARPVPLLRRAAPPRARVTGTEGAARAARREERAAQWAQLGALCKQEAPLLVASTFFMIGAAVCDASIPYYTSAALYAATSGAAAEPGACARAVRRLVGVGVLSALFTGARGCAFWIAGARVLRRLKARLFAALLGKPTPFHDKLE